MAARVLQKHGFNPVVFEREPSREAREQGGQLDLHPKSGADCSEDQPCSLCLLCIRMV